MLKQSILSACTAICLIAYTNISAANIIVPMYLVNGDSGQSIGTVKLEKSRCGVLISPELHDLPPGVHGFHLHKNPSCDNKAMAAGDHLDYSGTNQHNGPYKDGGHIGDLPVLIVKKDGTANLPMLAPRLKFQSLKNHSLVIHAGADNYSDEPAKLGGGGERIACGVIDKK